MRCMHHAVKTNQTSRPHCLYTLQCLPSGAVKSLNRDSILQFIYHKKKHKNKHDNAYSGERDDMCLCDFSVIILLAQNTNRQT